MNRQQSTMTIVDLREVAASDRRLKVFDAFEHLLPGEVLVLVHNHHSKPLFYLFLAESPRGFTWDYLEQGPDIWRIRIKKTRRLAASSYCLH